MNIESLTVGEFGVNCFIVEGRDRRALVIDPGADAAQIDAMLSARSLTVSAYLLTHGHIDHISAVAELCDTRPAPVAMHASDRKWAFDPGNQFLPFYPSARTPTTEFRLVGDGEPWEDAGLAYEILATPGHTPGGVCYWFKTARALFTGDTLFAGSVGRTDLPGGDWSVLERSLKRLAAMPGNLAVYPGHGPSTSIEAERDTNPFLQ